MKIKFIRIILNIAAILSMLVGFIWLLGIFVISRHTIIFQNRYASPIDYFVGRQVVLYLIYSLHGLLWGVTLICASRVVNLYVKDK